VITKQQIMDETSGLLGIRRFQVSTGSTEPKEFFVAVINALGIGGDITEYGKQELAKLIVESSGNPWKLEFDSTGATVTTAGLLAVQKSVAHFCSTRPVPGTNSAEALPRGH